MTWTTLDEPEAVTAVCHRAFARHGLEVLDATTDFQVRYRVARLGPVTLGDITYGTDVRLDFTDPMPAYQVHVPLSAALVSTHQGAVVTACPGSASVFEPGGEGVITRWPGGGRVLVLKIDNSAFPGRTPVLGGHLDLTSAPVRAGSTSSRASGVSSLRPTPY